MSGGGEVGIFNDVNDVLFFYVPGSAGEFKIFLTAAASTISDTLLTEANVMALVNAAPTWQAYLKYSPLKVAARLSRMPLRSASNA